MYTEKFKNNKVEIMGKVTKSLTFSHELCGESFYESEITVSRLSGVEDKIPVLISDRIIDIGKDYTGDVYKRQLWKTETWLVQYVCF